MASDTVLHCALKAQANNRRLLEILIEHGTDVRAVGADRISVPPHSFPGPLHESWSCARVLNASPSLRFPPAPPAVDPPPPPGPLRSAPPAALGAEARGAQCEEMLLARGLGDLVDKARARLPAEEAAGRTGSGADHDPRHFPWLRQYVSSYIETHADGLPAKPTFDAPTLQVPLPARPAPGARWQLSMRDRAGSNAPLSLWTGLSVKGGGLLSHFRPRSAGRVGVCASQVSLPRRRRSAAGATAAPGASRSGAEAACAPQRLCTPSLVNRQRSPLAQPPRPPVRTRAARPQTYIIPAPATPPPRASGEEVLERSVALYGERDGRD